MRTLLLLSGGIDSTATLELLLENRYDTTLLFIDYGQKAKKMEYASALTLAKYYKCEINRVKCSNNLNFREGEIIGRNLFLISTGLLYASNNYEFIATGIHSDTKYVDCKPDFIARTHSIIELISNYQIKLICPLLNWKKIEVYEYCLKKEVPIELCYSCENGGEQPCQKCNSCKDIKLLNEYKKQKNNT